MCERNLKEKWCKNVEILFCKSSQICFLFVGVLYDRVLKWKLILKLPTSFLNYEGGTSRAGNSKSNKKNNKKKVFCFHFMFWIFTLLKFLVHNSKKRKIQNEFWSSVPYHRYLYWEKRKEWYIFSRKKIL